MAYETEKIMRERRKVFSASFSKTVTDFLLYDKSFTESEKQEILRIARSIAFSKGHIRVYWEDFQEGIREWLKQKEVKK
ncbi:MAG: hypothetical protein QXL51_01260 [Candidatus Aenigmatarchaeota archaeon]